MPTHTLIHLRDIGDKGLEIVEVKIPPNAPTIGKPVKELTLPEGSVLSLVIRKARRPIVPSGATILQAEDQIIAVTAHESEEALRAALSGQ